jgi:saxitoxin biosynthesis operon SxtJ-like protein
MPGDARAELRKFGLTVGAAFAVLGLVSAWRGHVTPPRVLWTLAVLLVVPALVAPGVLGPVRHGWMRFAVVVGEVNSRILLGVFFYLVLAPVGFVLRRVRDPLNRSLTDPRPSQWIKRERVPVERARYERQF